MKTARATVPLLVIIAVLGAALALIVHNWATAHTDSLTLQTLPTAGTYALVVWGITHALDLAYVQTLTGSLHLLAVPLIVTLVLAALVVTAAEKQASSTDQQPTWGVLAAQLVQHGIQAMRSAVAA